MQGCCFTSLGDTLGTQMVLEHPNNTTTLVWTEGYKGLIHTHHVGSYQKKIAGETTWPWWASRNLVDADGNFSSRIPARYAANSFPSEQSSSRKSSIAWNAAIFGKKQADQKVIMGKDDEKKKQASKLQIFLAGGSSRPKRVHEKNLSRSIQLHFTHLLSLRHRRNGESSLRTRRRDWLPELALKNRHLHGTLDIFSGKKEPEISGGFSLKPIHWSIRSTSWRCQGVTGWCNKHRLKNLGIPPKSTKNDAWMGVNWRFHGGWMGFHGV